MPQKQYNYTRKVLYGIGDGGWGGGCKSDYKDCFRSQKMTFFSCLNIKIRDLIIICHC